jgi:hypothetical protein
MESVAGDETDEHFWMNFQLMIRNIYYSTNICTCNLLKSLIILQLTPTCFSHRDYLQGVLLCAWLVIEI